MSGSVELLMRPPETFGADRKPLQNPPMPRRPEVFWAGSIPH